MKNRRGFDSKAWGGRTAASLVLFFGVRLALIRRILGSDTMAVVDGMRKVCLVANIVRRSGSSRVRITNCPRGDGGGAQLQASLAVMVMSRIRGMHYVHTPLSAVAHAEGLQDEWVQRWNSILKFPEVLDNGNQTVNLDSKWAVFRGLFSATESTVYFSSHFRSVADSSGRFYELCRNLIRALYEPENVSAATRPKHLGRHIAVHVRRGDVAEVGPESFRFTPNQSVVSVVEAIRREGRGDTVTVFSNGRQDELDDFVRAGYTLKLESDAIQALHEIVSADVFVMSKSSFSYLGGLLSNGRVVYEPFWHPPLPSWEERSNL